MDNSSETSSRNLIAAACFILVLLGVLAFGQLHKAQFVYYDDQNYVTDNPFVRAGLTPEGFQWAMITFFNFNWHPLTWLSYMTDISLWGFHPGPIHVTNICFHLANALLLFWILNSTTQSIWRSFFVSALFLVHPLHMESVAWISERKDVLSLFFMLLALKVYSGRGFDGGESFWRPGLAALFYTAALMSKVMVLTFPVLLLLWDIWPLKRFRKIGDLPALVREKTSLFLISFVVIALNLLAQHQGGAVQASGHFPFLLRLLNAVLSYGIYLEKTFLPVNLAVYYPYPQVFPVQEAAIAFCPLLLISLLAFQFFRTRPYFFAGWFWYLLSLVPAIGIVQIGTQALADRYTYIPLIGLFIVITWGAADFTQRWKRAPLVLIPAAFLILTVLTGLSRAQAEVWINTEILFKHALAVTRDNDKVHHHLAGYLGKIGKYDQAAEHYEQAIRLRSFPQKISGYNNLANDLAQKREFEHSLAVYKAILKADPSLTPARFNMAYVLEMTGETEAAREQYQAVLDAHPDNEQVRSRLAALTESSISARHVPGTND